MATRGKRQPMEIRGLMLDPARLTERHEFYFDLLADLAKWGINTLWWHFSDDEGFPLKLRSHPELATPYALTRAETRRFIRAARDVGIDVVPEVESLGHARYITRLPQYAHLANGDPMHHSSICPSHPQTPEVLGEIITEVAEIFGSPYFHAGLDEADLRGCRRCDRRGKGKPRWWVYAQHVKAIHGIVTAAGKRMIMWADHVERDPAMLRVLPTDIIMAHWNYWAVPTEHIRRTLAAGFEVICAPAMCFHGHVLQPHTRNFENMDGMLTAAAALAPRGVLGLVNTWWAPWRGLRDAYLFAVAYTGEMLRRGKPADKVRFARRFAKDYFALDDAAAATAIWSIHEQTLTMQDLPALLFDSPADVHDALAMAGSPGFGERTETVNRCIAALAVGRKKVRRHRDAYDAVVLAARVAGASLGGAGKLLDAHAAYGRAENACDRSGPAAEVAAHLDQAGEVLAAILGEVESITAAVDREWDRTRHPSDAKKAAKGGAATARSFDVLLNRMVRHRDYLRALCKGLRKGTAAYRRTGRLPTGV
ncbi:MAG TPA: family 20 glycosylhydrolase [Phycisphaerae bacterium]|nr:family 20 glycosylhydrolase [Phycisphaerae bacterium]